MNPDIATSKQWWTSPCELWRGSVDRETGYGFIFAGTKALRAHRVAWEAKHGPVPEGLVLDHLCRNRACVNLDHLEPVTHRVNVLRGVGPTARNAAKTHCNRGHELAGANMRRDRRGRRVCHQCELIQSRKKRAAIRESRKGE